MTSLDSGWSLVVPAACATQLRFTSYDLTLLLLLEPRGEMGQGLLVYDNTTNCSVDSVCLLERCSSSDVRTEIRESEGGFDVQEIGPSIMQVRLLTFCSKIAYGQQEQDVTASWAHVLLVSTGQEWGAACIKAGCIANLHRSRYSIIYQSRDTDKNIRLQAAAYAGSPALRSEESRV